MAGPGQIRLEKRVDNIVTIVRDIEARLRALESGFVYVNEDKELFCPACKKHYIRRDGHNCPIRSPMKRAMDSLEQKAKENTYGQDKPTDGGRSLSAHRLSEEAKPDDPSGEKDAAKVGTEPVDPYKDGGDKGVEQGASKRGPGRPRGSKNKPAKKLRKGDGGKAA